MTRDPWNAMLGIAEKPPNRHKEEDLQAAIWQHILLRKAPNVIAYAVPNGGQRSKRAAARLKAQGVVAGVADLGFVLSDGTAAWMELKIPGNYQSAPQKAFQAQCEAIGVPYVVCYSLDSALTWLKAMGVIR